MPCHTSLVPPCLFSFDQKASTNLEEECQLLIHKGLPFLRHLERFKRITNQVKTLMRHSELRLNRLTLSL